MATYYTGFHCEDAWMRRNGKTVQQRQHAIDYLHQEMNHTREDSDAKVARSLNLYALEMIDQQQQNDLLQLWCNKVGYTGNSLKMK
ncbi:hypothetical protein T02_14943 [Trichinella nativa]|uniref:Uncharacterized protein n=1 Tax=Trichinella nativa TaxID=6335 RepID=A0A0V1L2L2_9BILA|nr:hypothetical protein T02_14943 [Trichinella nativa]